MGCFSRAGGTSKCSCASFIDNWRLMHALCRCKPQLEQLIPDVLFALGLAALSSACAVPISLELTMVSHFTERLGKRGK